LGTNSTNRPPGRSKRTISAAAPVVADVLEHFVRKDQVEGRRRVGQSFAGSANDAGAAGAGGGGAGAVEVELEPMCAGRGAG
jgi:hypothetical protein